MPASSRPSWWPLTGYRAKAERRELDSLADVISFGVARYNVTAEALSGGTGKVKYFEGTPIPTSIILVFVLALAAWSGAVRQDLWFGEVTLLGFKLHPLVFMFAISGALMISRLRIPKP